MERAKEAIIVPKEEPTSFLFKAPRSITIGDQSYKATQINFQSAKISENKGEFILYHEKLG